MAMPLEEAARALNTRWEDSQALQRVAFAQRIAKRKEQAAGSGPAVEALEAVVNLINQHRGGESAGLFNTVCSVFSAPAPEDTRKQQLSTPPDFGMQLAHLVEAHRDDQHPVVVGFSGDFDCGRSTASGQGAREWWQCARVDYCMRCIG